MESSDGGEGEDGRRRKLEDAVGRTEADLEAEDRKRRSPSGEGPAPQAPPHASTRRFRLAFALAIAGSAALSGCAAGAATSPVPAAAVSGIMVDDEAIRDLNERHRHHPQGGVAMFVALSLDTLGLSPVDEAVVAKIQSDLFAAMEPARAGVQRVLSALADGMAAGAIDGARIGAAIAEVERASAPVHEATVDALRRLHAVLAPPQRAALVDKILAHWAVSRRANAEDAQEGREGHLADLAGELGLSADQVARIGVSFQAAMRRPSRLPSPTTQDRPVATGEGSKQAVVARKNAAGRLRLRGPHLPRRRHHRLPLFGAVPRQLSATVGAPTSQDALSYAL